MPSPGWENLDEFFDTDDFATLATFVSATSQVSRQVKGIFDEPYFDKQLGEYVQDAGDPRITCKETAARGLKKHDGCTIDSMPGAKYVVSHDPKFDGTGTCVVYLNRVE
ncbi:cementing protein [Xanthomonas phage M29]|nr:cementing protein [Xanthomonas phage M29]WNL50846.1 tail attachment protein [Xanthomonas phage Murka]